MNHKSTAIISLCVALIFFVLLPTWLVWFVDPCQIFHKPPKSGWLSHDFSYEERCQNAGLINSYLGNPADGFDSLITGTSLTNNFLPNEIEKNNSVQKTMKLILRGVKPIEQKIMMGKALATGADLKKVLWEIFPYPYIFHSNDSLEKILHSDVFPAYLYNASVLDDYRYVFNITSFRYSIGVVFGEGKDEYTDIGLLTYRDNGCPRSADCSPFHKKSDIDEIRRNYKVQNRILRAPDDFSGLNFDSVDKMLLDTVMPYCNRPLQFDFYFPPLSYWWFSIQNDQDFDFQLYMLRYIVEKTAACKNIRIFAFNDEQWIAGDLAHYRDQRHFFGDVPHYIIESIGKGRHIINLENINGYEKRFVEAVNTYQPWASTQEQMKQNARY